MNFVMYWDTGLTCHRFALRQRILNSQQPVEADTTQSLKIHIRQGRGNKILNHCSVRKCHSSCIQREAGVLSWKIVLKPLLCNAQTPECQIKIAALILAFSSVWSACLCNLNNILLTQLCVRNIWKALGSGALDFTEHCSSPPEFSSLVILLPAHTGSAALYQSLSFPVSLLYHMPFLRTASSPPATHPASSLALAFIAALLIICSGNHDPRTTSTDSGLASLDIKQQIQ